jgi:hypothetical protein
LDYVQAVRSPLGASRAGFEILPKYPRGIDFASANHPVESHGLATVQT